MRELRWGLSLPFSGVRLSDHEALVRQAESSGYDDLWAGESNGVDAFSPLVLAAAWTKHLRLGTAVVNPFTRSIPVLAQHATALADASGGRFVLGLGSSSQVIVEQWSEVPFERPLTRVREAVGHLRSVLAGGRGPGDFRLFQPPERAVPIFVAALGNRMLSLSGEIADGALINLLPLSGTEQVVRTIRAAEAAAGRGPIEVASRIVCIPTSMEEGRHDARRLMVRYATVPVYEAFFRSLGWGAALDPMLDAWRAGDRRVALQRVPDDLIREVFVFGEPATQVARLQEFAARGISTLVISPMCASDQLAAVIDALSPPSHRNRPDSPG